MDATTNEVDGYAGYFYGNIYASGTYTGSDEKLKKNITIVDNALDIIKKLQPKYYEYRDDNNYAKMNLPTGKHCGLIAQDVETVLPNLVKESEFNVTCHDELKTKVTETPGENKSTASATLQTVLKHEMINFKAVNYTELIPILIKALQEVNTQKDSLAAKVSDMQIQINELKLMMAKIGNGNVYTQKNGYLQQNIPNPSGSNTVIAYYLPESTGNGQIIITDEKGSMLKKYPALSGTNQLSINSGQLPSGIYNYTLYADNKVINTRQMVIVR